MSDDERLDGPAFAELRAIRATGEKTYGIVLGLAGAVSGHRDELVALQHVTAQHAQWIAADQRAIAELAARPPVTLVVPAPAKSPRRRMLDRIVVGLLTLLAIAGFSTALYISQKGP